MSPLVERQVDLEYEALSLGAARYEERRQEQGDSGTKPGEWAINQTAPVLTAAIEAFIESAAGVGKAGRKHSALPFLVCIQPASAAYLTLRYALDGASSVRPVNTVALELGNAVQDHINLLAFRSDDSEDKLVRQHQRRLFAKVEEQVKKATTARHRQGVWRHVLAKYRPAALKWNDEAKLNLGVKLIELLEESTELVRLQRQTEGRHDTPVYVMLTDKAQEKLGDAHSRASYWFPVHQPMVVQPRDWTSPFSGGYLTSALRPKLVLTHSRGYLDELRNIDMPAVYQAVNSIQRTPWKINTALLAVATEARNSGEKFQSLLAEAQLPLPVRPAGIDKDVKLADLPVEQREAVMEWKTRIAETYEENASRRSNFQAMLKKLGVAQKFSEFEAIWFPHCLDFRGRIYPLANYLNPQGDDLARGLLQFAEGKALGQRGVYWLKVHVAGLFGIDKVSFDERVKWTNANMDKLLDSAAAPLDGGLFWSTAENPWQALAACFELAGAMVQGVDYVSHLPIAMDGSCSGLQHYSAMLRDPIGGAAVNLVPAPKPGDIYTEVARRAQAFINSSLEEDAAPWKGDKVVRKIAKQPTMTYCYSATQYGMGKQIMKAVDGLGGKAYLGGGNVNVKQSSVFMAGVVRAAIGETVVAAKTAMEFLQAVAVLAAQKGLPINWTAPSGFPVAQEYREIVGERINVFYQGVRLRLTIRKDGDRLDPKRQASGVAPNFVHSLDSAHLMATVNIGTENDLFSWACIHDSFGVHACDVDTLHVAIREAFIEQYTPDVLARFREQIVQQLQAQSPELIEDLPDLPAQGELELASLRDAAYFFA